MKINTPKIRKRTPDEVRSFIKKRCETANLQIAAPPGRGFPATSSTGSMATGPELLRAVDSFDLLPISSDRTKLFASFSTLTKYQALQVLINGPIGKKYPEVVDKIADAITETDYAAEVNPPPM